jgi:hypothetical protein
MPQILIGEPSQHHDDKRREILVLVFFKVNNLPCPTSETRSTQNEDIATANFSNFRELEAIIFNLSMVKKFSHCNWKKEQKRRSSPKKKNQKAMILMVKKFIKIWKLYTFT